ncbi:MAG: HAD family hydrolase [Patescibacteria group bacterium]|nr:MAG: HAD family hydrolase [Patescibacteria group bacterium]
MASSLVLKAVIFDLDGTLIDNEGVYDRAFCQILKKRDISCEEVVHIPGIGVRENWEKMVANIGMDEDPKDLAQETQEFYLQHLKEVEVRYGVRELLYYLRGEGIKILLATSNTAKIGNKVLEALGIGHHFETRTFGDEVSQKKPAPDLFLKAMEKEGLNPRSVIIIEDSPSGVAAAKAAGTKVIAIKTDWATRSQLSRADRIAGNFAQITELIKQEWPN